MADWGTAVAQEPWGVNETDNLLPPWGQSSPGKKLASTLCHLDPKERKNRGEKKKTRKKAAWVYVKVTLSHPTARTSTTISVTFGDTNTRTSVKTKRRTVTIVVEHVSRAPRSCDAIKGWNVPALQHKNETTCTETHFMSTCYIVVKLPVTPPPWTQTHTYALPNTVRGLTVKAVFVFPGLRIKSKVRFS